MRILIAGGAGAVAMFIWMSIAHMLTPLGMIGYSQLPDEAPVIAAVQGTVQKNGLYLFPWVDPTAKDAMAQFQEKAKSTGSGMLLYKVPPAPESFARNLVIEFLTEFVACILAAFLLAQTMIASYAMRAGFVTLVGVIVVVATHVSNWTWLGYPVDYTGAAIFIQVVGFLAAGFAIAFFIKPKAA